MKKRLMRQPSSPKKIKVLVLTQPRSLYKLLFKLFLR